MPRRPHRGRAGGFRHFRCHVGHAFSLDNLVTEQSEDVERALWAAVRSLEEGAALSRRPSRTQPGKELQRRFSEKEHDLLHRADLIRRILLQGVERPDEGAPGGSTGDQRE